MNRREILFRGKAVIGSEWIYGFYVKDDEDALIAQWNDKDGKFDYYAVIPDTIGQLVISKSYEHNEWGFDVFEGDIIKSGWNGNIELVTFEIFDNAQGYMLDLDDVFTELLGNIHDNPELTKQS